MKVVNSSYLCTPMSIFGDAIDPAQNALGHPNKGKKGRNWFQENGERYEQLLIQDG
uniref:Uncharacterized protein n=1 Tax=Podarcis muralis TaxID=64176 RepID=A0A670IIL1_PODMU